VQCTSARDHESRTYAREARGTAAALGVGMSHSNFVAIDSSLLGTISGGQATQQEEGPPPRTWGQMGREYAGACVTGAAQSMIYGGRPRNWRQGLTNAAVGCAMGVGMKAVEDVGAAISGTQP
jgi:hypothetical protein